MNKKILIMIFIVIVVVGAVLAMTVFKNGNTNEVAYKMEAVDIGNIQAVVDTTGTLNPVTTVDVGSQVSGKIQDLFADFNSQVRKGQIIAKIDPELFETRVSQSEANYQSSKASLDKSKLTLENNKRKYERAKNLFEKELISFEEKETAETQYFSAVADLQSAEARLAQANSQLDTSKVDLKNTIILSPIDGVVINRNFNVGQTVAASFQAPVLFQIANDLSKMQVECSVDEADIG
ncbi:MAG: efflux RND transporter periplasmic adaptor subunit, partial [Candidatus Aminicenantes bacterium]|nr:efflux RND transporter periplasmic adaptor subunit [Candidatus Aminicenantes bacterium]